MDKIRTIVDKEWAEVFKNRLVLFTIAFLPLLFTVLPLGVLYGLGSLGGAGNSSDIPPQFFRLCGDVAPDECFQIYLIDQFLVLFMMMPLIIPVSIAAYSIVGEKTTRSLEPLLATPISTIELLTAKALAAVIPAILATWISFIIFVIAAPFVGARPAMMANIFSPVWLSAVFVAGPLMAVMAVNFAIIISSRVTDPRAAEQMAAVVVVPMLAIIFGQLAGVIVLNLTFMLIAIAILLMIDIGLIYLGAQLFQRETILTKWK